MKKVLLTLSVALFAFTANAQEQLKWNKAWNELPIFEAQYYRTNNLDVAKAGVDALEHWKKTGLDEGRTASPVFDVKYYIENNPDVADRFGKVDYRRATQHYLDYGIKEGRPSHPNFNVQDYAELNKDLYQVYGKQYEKLLEHYLKTGISENRPTIKK